MKVIMRKYSIIQHFLIMFRRLTKKNYDLKIPEHFFDPLYHACILYHQNKFMESKYVIIKLKTTLCYNLRALGLQYTNYVIGQEVGEGLSSLQTRP